MKREESERVTDCERDPTWVRTRELTVVEQERVKAMQRLANAPDRRSYLAVEYQDKCRCIKLNVALL